MKIPLVSVIIPLYDREEIVKETLESVLAQTYPHWECIIVDDASTDNSLATAKEYAACDNRFKVFQRHREPKGAPTCRNIGLAKAEGDLVIFLDSDDLLTDFCLARRVEKFEENSECDFLVFQSVISKKINGHNYYYWNVENEESDLQRFLRTEALWQTGGVVYRRDYIAKNGGFTEGLQFWQDTELGMRLLLKKPIYRKFFNIQPDLIIKQTPKSVSRSHGLIDNLFIITNRLNVLYQILYKLQDEDITISKEEMRTLWSVCYFLSGNFLLSFSEHKQYYKNWSRCNRLLRKGSINFVISYLYLYILYWRKHSKYLIKARSIYTKMFHKYLPDINELSKCKLCNEPLKEGL